MSKGIESRLAAVLSAMTEVGKGGRNPHFKSEYVQLDDLLAHLRPRLAREGLSVSQELTGEGVVTRLYSDDGDTLELGRLPLPQLADPQKMGSAITYFRRYSLMAAFGLAGGEDDDGNLAAQPPQKRQEKAEPSNQQRFGKFCEVNGIDKKAAALWLVEQFDRPASKMTAHQWTDAAKESNLSRLLDWWNSREAA